MKTYQTLSLIGCIIGIFLMLGLSAIMGVGTFFMETGLNMTKTFGNASQLASEQKTHDIMQARGQPFIAGLWLSFFLYIVLIPVTFIIKTKTKVAGIVLILLGLLTTAITNLWGIIPFALLLPAGILAIRYKQPELAN